MEYKITKLQNDKGLDIDIVNIINSNNYSFSFYTYGGYMSEVCIPISSNVSETAVSYTHLTLPTSFLV